MNADTELVVVPCLLCHDTNISNDMKTIMKRVRVRVRIRVVRVRVRVRVRG